MQCPRCDAPLNPRSKAHGNLMTIGCRCGATVVLRTRAPSPTASEQPAVAQRADDRRLVTYLVFCICIFMLAAALASQWLQRHPAFAVALSAAKAHAGVREMVGRRPDLGAFMRGDTSHGAAQFTFRLDGNGNDMKLRVRLTRRAGAWQVESIHQIVGLVVERRL